MKDEKGVKVKTSLDIKYYVFLRIEYSIRVTKEKKVRYD